MRVKTVDIIDLSENAKEDYFTCLEEWSDAMKDSGAAMTDWGISYL
jgi:hypothetical protein